MAEVQSQLSKWKINVDHWFSTQISLVSRPKMSPRTSEIGSEYGNPWLDRPGTTTSSASKHYKWRNANVQKPSETIKYLIKSHSDSVPGVAATRRTHPATPRAPSRPQRKIIGFLMIWHQNMTESEQLCDTWNSSVDETVDAMTILWVFPALLHVSL